jgi:signal recognition particle subunit SRP54
MFESLSERIDSALKVIKGKNRITEINVAEAIKDIRRALVDADVNYKIAKEITDRIKEQALGQKVLIAVEPGQLMVKIVHDELARLMGGQKKRPCAFGQPCCNSDGRSARFG